ncbi:TolB family protein [Calidithermus timidus]|jgi:TolB protein|uniref:TolB family protein n=1 Tax=Calidithermus timidus TaxID=307124 RepID=UPI0003826842|nr:PD40 domain-containing protein [Calidithermus timidus]
MTRLFASIVGLLVFSACMPAAQKQPQEATPAATANVLEITRVTNDPTIEFWPRPSPDGKSLLYGVYDRTKKGGAAFSVELVATEGVGKRLVAGPGAGDATWLPDGSGFVYVNVTSGRPLLVRSPISGIGTTFITNNPAGTADGQPDVSPDGKRVVFNTLIRGEATICTIGIDGSGFTIYVPGSSPRWNPSGERLVFDRKVGSKYQIFTLDIKSGQVTQLTTGSYDNSFPSWSPDGNWITFQSNRDGRFQVYIMKADGTAITQLTKGDASAWMPNWSADGYVYFASSIAQAATVDEWQASDIWRVKPKLP